MEGGLNGGRALKKMNAKKGPSQPAAGPGPPWLVFGPTNINMRLFQQFNLFEDSWCQVGAFHQ